MLVSKVYGIDCGTFKVVRNDGIETVSPFFIGEEAGDVIIVSSDKKELFSAFDSKLFQVCDYGEDEISMREMIIAEQESTIKEDWFEI